MKGQLEAIQTVTGYGVSCAEAGCDARYEGAVSYETEAQLALSNQGWRRSMSGHQWYCSGCVSRGLAEKSSGKKKAAGKKKTAKG